MMTTCRELTLICIDALHLRVVGYQVKLLGSLIQILLRTQSVLVLVVRAPGIQVEGRKPLRRTVNATHHSPEA